MAHFLNLISPNNGGSLNLLKHEVNSLTSLKKIADIELELSTVVCKNCTCGSHDALHWNSIPSGKFWQKHLAKNVKNILECVTLLWQSRAMLRLRLCLIMISLLSLIPKATKYNQSLTRCHIVKLCQSLILVVRQHWAAAGFLEITNRFKNDCKNNQSRLDFDIF